MTQHKADPKLKLLFGKRLQQRREELGLTAEDVAQAVGRRGPGIRRMEIGESGATMDTLVALASILETSIDWLLGIAPQESRQESPRRSPDRSPKRASGWWA